MTDLATITAERDAARAELNTERVARCFDGSQFIRERLTVHPDLMLARFGKNFAIEDGRAVAKDDAGQVIMSRATGDIADFDEALGILVSQTDYADKITRRPRGSGVQNSDGTLSDVQPFTLPDGTKGFALQKRDMRPNAELPPMARAAYDKLTPWDQARWATGGGRISN